MLNIVKKLRCFPLLFLTLITMGASATQQIREVLELDGARFDIDEFPLDSHPEIVELVKKIDSRTCSAAWRGYKALWTIRKDKLYLSHIVKNPCAEKSRRKLRSAEYIYPNNLFNTETSDYIANWYSGKITFRISDKVYVYKSGVTGQKYEAVVYDILNGEVISRNIETVERIWE
ncbi:hypothetical protein MHM98_05340 [Psychrobium sp. MM17-31]|uniref:hypothetical protein n=1 Tax=Psychrobium sp. MM17-31 TaxID=2917758 RepID=UPI001EF65680|nr:hypothetical protein [Psychrobium sp. MM17-31]MCG7530780.1 hypothetical protein [Psychrobium sp. MM17-31]